MNSVSKKIPSKAMTTPSCIEGVKNNKSKVGCALGAGVVIVLLKSSVIGIVIAAVAGGAATAYYTNSKKKPS
jgi:ABC-type enterobactin transport system permease subunit